MPSGAVFRLTRSAGVLASLPLGESAVTASDAAAIHELQPCGFQVEGREPDCEYRLWIGDADPEAAPGAGGPRPVGVPYGSAVFWDEAAHFSGARGRVWVRLGSRPAGSDQEWTTRALLPVQVVATKLSEARYQVMVAQLRALAAGLVLDLVSKMFRSLGLAAAEHGISTRSSQLELRLLERLWAELARPLQEIVGNPALQISRAAELRPAWGGERLGATAVARLASQGVDPRRRAVARPFAAYQERFVESPRTAEHRIILGMLRFLEHRVGECRQDVRRHIQAIIQERPARQIGPAHEPSLYELEDAPRLESLRQARARAERLGRRILLAQHSGPWRGLTPLFRFPHTPVFEHVAPYHRLRHEFRRYLHSSLVMLDDGFEERLKSTSRLYERWVFFQLAAALRAAGLRCVQREGLFHRARRFRFTLDLDRGAGLTFLAADGRRLRLRFEPWVWPRAEAEARGEALYRGTRGEAAWSPDVTIELLAGAEEVEYAAVVDAKYAGRVQEHHWQDTAKYLEIRATRTRRQVVKQLWLAYPGNTGIVPRDEDVAWGPEGPDCPRDEVVRGALGLAPPERLTEPAEEAGWLRDPVDTAVRFITGLLAYLDIPHQAPVTSLRE
jgi:hypothetical protein